PFESELRDHGLARAGGGGDKDGLAPVEGLDRRPLELVQRERVGPGEPGRIGHLPPSLGTRRALPGGSAAPRTYRSSGGMRRGMFRTPPPGPFSARSTPPPRRPTWRFPTGTSTRCPRCSCARG